MMKRELKTLKPGDQVWTVENHKIQKGVFVEYRNRGSILSIQHNEILIFRFLDEAFLDLNDAKEYLLTRMRWHDEELRGELAEQEALVKEHQERIQKIEALTEEDF